jgi:predicted O-methyltransferase YrrM
MEEKDIIEMMGNIKHRIFPRAFERLGVKGNNLIGAEIGIYKGEHALSLLENLNIKKLYLIDPYSDYGEENEDYGIASLNLSEMIADKKLRKYKDKIVKVKKLSSRCLEDIPNELDFVYIDGNHDYDFVKEDIENYYPKIKKGGIIGGHDFYNGFAKDHDGVIRAVIEFSVKNNLQLNAELPDWWVVKEN